MRSLHCVLVFGHKIFGWKLNIPIGHKFDATQQNARPSVNIANQPLAVAVHVNMYNTVFIGWKCLRWHWVTFTSTYMSVLGSLVPRPIPSFSMFHAEKQEGLVLEITWTTSLVYRRYARDRQKVYCMWLDQRSSVLWAVLFLTGQR